MYANYREIFIIGRKYRVLEDLQESRFKKGEIVTYYAGAWSRYDEGYAYIFVDTEGHRKYCWVSDTNKDGTSVEDQALCVRKLQAKFEEVYEVRQLCPLEYFLVNNRFDKYAYRIHSLKQGAEVNVLTLKKDSGIWRIYIYNDLNYTLNREFKNEKDACRFLIDKILEDPKNHMDYETKGEAHVLELYKKIRECKEYENYLSLEVPELKE